MKPLLVINDVHLGVKRMAGTTPQSQLELRQDLHNKFSALINAHTDKDLLINGDLFDGFEVEINDVLITYFNLSSWCRVSGNKLYLVAGNHDIGKRTDKLSSFDLLGELLSDRCHGQVFVIRDGLETVCDQRNIHVIPHCMNQDLFNLELEKALKVEPGFLLLHANVDNGFAEASDHSLNVDGEWLTRLSKRHVVMFAHEHQARVVQYGYKAVFVMGNQWPSSVADCLAHGEAQKDGVKKAHVIHTNGAIEPIVTWKRDGNFTQMDWAELTDCPAPFIRITGKATAEQASDVISAIARYRTQSSAYVITNGVQIEGVAGVDDFSEISYENIKAFDVLSALLDQLEPPEQKAVQELLA